MRSAQVTTIVTAFNCEPFVGDALRSVLAQTEGEVIVVDDASTDATASVVAECPSVRYLRHDANSGPAAARNTGLSAARGEVIAFLDGDDLWSPEKMAMQLAHLEREPGLQIVLGRLRFFHTPEVPADDEAHLVYSFGAALVRREAFERAGPIDESLRFGEDTDWFLKVRELEIPTHVHDDVVLLYRRHESNMTLERTAETRKADLFGVIRRSVKRRQEGGQPASSLPVLGHRR